MARVPSPVGTMLEDLVDGGVDAFLTHGALVVPEVIEVDGQEQVVGVGRPLTREPGDLGALVARHPLLEGVALTLSGPQRLAAAGCRSPERHRVSDVVGLVGFRLGLGRLVGHGAGSWSSDTPCGRALTTEGEG